MKQRLNKLLAIVLTASLCVPMLPAGTVRAAGNGSVTFSEEQEVKVSHYGTERVSLFNDNWKFYLGTSSQAQEPSFNDSAWDTVDLPHDFSISQNFTTAGEAESGFLPGGTGWYRKKFTLPESCAGKSVVLNFDGVYSIATVFVNGTQVGENRYGYNPFSFDITDYLTCDGETENVIAVQAVNNIPSSRWYSGSGIYRDVKLIVTDPVHVAKDGTYVTTPNLKTSNGTDGTVNVAVDVQNDSNSSANVTVRNTVYEKGGTEAVASAEASVTVAAGATATATSSPVVSSPKLWSIDAPNLYVVRTEVVQNGGVTDTYDTEFGFKWYEFVDNVGFKLNGQNVKINGVCMHHDQGALGAAAYYDAMYRQLAKMKDMGVNTIRITHNPGDEDFVNICNEIGLLVIEEVFDGWHFHKNGNSNDFATYFNQNLSADNRVIGGSSTMTWAEFVLKSIIKRDRNDASVILWSLGNEIQEGAGGNGWGPIARNMIRWAEDVDTAHLLTSGSNNKAVSTDDNNSACVNKILYDNGGVAGFNYGNADDMDSLHGTYGVFLYSETASAVNSRGQYRSQASQGDADGKKHLTSYDTSCVGWGKTAHDSMWTVLTRDYLAGECVWTGFDYIGEPTPWNGTGAGGSSSGLGAAPNSSYFGIVETTGFEKDNFYLYRSQWNQDANTLHLVTAWDSDNMMNNNGKTPVWVYSNAAKVELYRDGKLIGTATGTQNTTSAGHHYMTYTTQSNDSSLCQTSSGTNATSLYSVFNVAFTNGTISARAYDASGNEITSSCSGKTSVTTPGAASRLEVSTDKTEILADGSSLAYISVDVTDADGNLDTTANPTIQFTLEGSGVIMGVDNGDQATVDKYQQASVIDSETSAHIKAYAGKALAIVRSTTKAGNIKVNVSSDGMAGETVSITTKSAAATTEKLLDSYYVAEHCYVPAGISEIPLPSTLSVSYTDGTKGKAAVKWNAYDKAQLKNEGLFTVTGSIPDGDSRVSLSITVHVYRPIASAAAYAGITRPGVMPTLPGTLMTYYADGTAFEEFPVTWNLAGITENSFAKAESVVKISGTVNALGSTFPATATIRVATAIPGESENKAPAALHLTEDQTYSDNVKSLIDESRVDSGKSESRWSTYNMRQSASAYSAVITMDWATVTTANAINLFFVNESLGAAMPTSIKFEYTKSSSWDGDKNEIISDTWQEIKYSNPTEIAGLNNSYTVGRHYELEEDINPIAIRVTFECAAGTFIGLNEIEVMGTSYTYQANSSADLGKVTIGGKDYTNMKEGEKLTVEADSLADMVLVNTNNAAATIIPDGKGGVTILSTSEDGTTTKSYQIALKSPATESAKSAALTKIQAAKAVDGTAYTAESYQALQKVIAELEKVIDLISSAKLEEYVKALAKAQAELKAKSNQVPDLKPIPDPIADPTPTPTPTIKAGDTTTANKIQFKVLNANAKTVAITKGTNKKATTVKVPNTVKVNGVSCKVVQIGKNAFKGYTKLKSVTIGKNVTTIESKAFYGCKKLSKVTFKGTAVKTIKSGAFKKTSSKMTVKVPKSLKKNKKTFAKFKKSLTKSGISKKANVK